MTTKASSFADLGVPDDILDALRAHGIEAPFPVQTLAVPDGLAGRDVCGQAKTGSGKTIAFGIPLVARTEKAEPRRPHALVLVPTRELAAQVHKELVWLSEPKGLRVAAFYGGVAMDRQLKALARGVDIAVATPGRLIDLCERKEAFLDAVTLLVLDEADRMADMGFMPQVEWLLRQLPSERQTMLFSATLDRDVDHLVSRYMKGVATHEVASESKTVEESIHRFLFVHQMDRVRVIASISKGVGRTLVFVRTKAGCDRLVRQLREEGTNAEAIHGDLRQQARDRALDLFKKGTLPVLVATDVAARGLHVDEVDVVLNYDPPEDHKAYLHRGGRTARAGATGVVVTFVMWNQVMEMEKLQKRLGLSVPMPEVFSNDKRLRHLADWDPAAD